MLRQLTAALAVALTGWGIALADQDPARASPAEALRIGIDLAMTGRNRAAAEIAEALLVRDPRDFQALVLKSRAARNLGKNKLAIDSARAAWRAAAGDAERYSAALVLAQALSSDGKRTRAQLWLRRATDLAPNDATRAVAIRDFRYVRARNPWATELRFNIAPSNNINNGSARETTQLFGLPFEFQLSGAAQALEGMEYAAGVATRYRFDQSPTYAQDVIFQLDHRTYSLSADARAQAPGVSGSDFAFSQAALGYAFQRNPQGGRGPYALNATAGQTWYGGDAYSQYLRFGGNRQLRLGNRTGLAVAASAERQFGLAGPDADVLKARVRLLRRIGDLGTLGLSLGRTASISDTDLSDYTETRTGIDFALAKPVLGARVRFGLQWRMRDYPVSRFDPAGRDDREISASVNLVFTQIEQFGFNPTLSLQTSFNDSNIGLYDSEKLGISLGIQSAF